MKWEEEKWQVLAVHWTAKNIIGKGNDIEGLLQIKNYEDFFKKKVEEET